MSEPVILNCPHSNICSVCAWIQIPMNQQREQKLEKLQSGLKSIGIDLNKPPRFVAVAPQELRDRVDLTYEEGRYGFFEKDSREIFQIDHCPLLSPALNQLFHKIKKIKIPVRKGSLRLRVSPTGQCGLWLDFANEDIRDLLAEKSTLQKFLDLGFVEIGQRRKKLTPQFKLADPEFHPWTRTWSEGQTIELFSLVGSFSQSGDQANQLLIQELQSLLAQSTSLRWVEFGAGSGNLTFPTAGANRHVRALEFEGLALKGLQKTLQSHPEFENRIQLLQGDFQRKDQTVFQCDEGVLVNPPRSGLKKFLDPLLAMRDQDRPRDFIYISCYLQSFLEDSQRLKPAGHALADIAIVDEFPHSEHFEILSLWQRN